MSSGNVWERILELEISANQLVLEGNRSPKDLAEILQEFVFGSVLPPLNWEEVYKALGMEKEYQEFTLSISPSSNRWVVPVLKDVTPNKVVKALRSRGVDVYVSRGDLDAGVTANDRDPNRDGSYVIAFHKTVEADKENADKSAAQLVKEGRQGIDLLERLLLGLGYFLTTGNHLDVNSWTLCTGSRGPGGRVPVVGRRADGRGIDVGWCRPGRSDGRLCSRSVAS